jgi:uncharacterized membrane protein SpoIIM required for sporulation
MGPCLDYSDPTHVTELPACIVYGIAIRHERFAETAKEREMHHDEWKDGRQIVSSLNLFIMRATLEGLVTPLTKPYVIYSLGKFSSRRVYLERCGVKITFDSE